MKTGLKAAFSVQSIGAHVEPMGCIVTDKVGERWQRMSVRTRRQPPTVKWFRVADTRADIVSQLENEAWDASADYVRPVSSVDAANTQSPKSAWVAVQGPTGRSTLKLTGAWLQVLAQEAGSPPDDGYAASTVQLAARLVTAEGYTPGARWSFSHVVRERALRLARTRRELLAHG